jgi:hypothetical protein
MSKRALTPGYILFYILFWPDTWRILIGIALACFLAPPITPPDKGVFVAGLIFVMVATIGYSVAVWPAKGITKALKKLILGNRLP